MFQSQVTHEIMAEPESHTPALLLRRQVISWAGWVSGHFPQKNPKKKQKQTGMDTATCYRCGMIMTDTHPCTYHQDVFVLSIPTKHMGLVMGKGKTKLHQIISSSGLFRLTVPDK